MSFPFSPEQLAVFDWIEKGRGNLILKAVAGAGKTTTLVEMARRMRGSVFLGAYNTKMGAELKTRVADLKNVFAGTFHSAGFSALRRVLGRVEVRGDKVKTLARAAIHGQPEEEQEGWAPAICQLVGMAKQVGFCVLNCVPAPTMSDWGALVAKYDVMDRLPEGASPRRLIELSAGVLEASNADRAVIDFDDMIYLPLYLDVKFFRNDWVLVDEAQDTNAVRREMARRMLKKGGRFVAVGDERQAIFGFTGADGDSLDLIQSTFEASTLALSVSWRCPKAVVRAAREFVSHIHAAPTAPEGEHLDVEYSEMLSLVSIGDAVLCRYNKHIVDLCFKLIRAGKPAKIEGRAIGEGLAALAGRWKVRGLDKLEDKLALWQDRETEKALAKGDEAKAERIEDQAATLRVLIERGREQGISTVDALKEMIRGMFDDVKEGDLPRLVVLSSVHRSKGLEWNRVFILGRRELMPSRRAVQAWQQEQEINLIYVALTRAKSTLVDVVLPPEARG